MENFLSHFQALSFEHRKKPLETDFFCGPLSILVSSRVVERERENDRFQSESASDIQV